ncbi:MAG: FAD:protein FMN transferase, partial [Candidatus Sericytochromatia bacterium]|nr:FAD:protein FMN transferase [Candidatus Tanganyikabacteria bacterium]
MMGNWAATALLLAVASGSAPAADGWLIRARYQMGTIWTIQARGPGVETAVEAAFDEIDRIERLLSTYRSDSEISRVNRQAGRAFVKVSPETSGLLRRSLAYARESGGAFDPTVGPLVRAWGFKHRDYRVPTPSALARARRSVGYRRVEMDAVRGIRLARQGMELDFGAIGKGYA